MSTITSWENIPSEIWFTILEKLPIKSQVSLACTCKKMYHMSLDPFLNNLEQRTWVYLKDKTPLPDLLAKVITILRVPIPQETGNDLEQRSLFLQGEIRRMSNLRTLILEQRFYSNEYFLSFADLQAVVLQQNLDELKVPKDFLMSKYPNGEKLLHLAVKKGNVKLVDSLLSQMQIHFQVHKLSHDPDFSDEINARDEQGNTPLKITVEQGSEELILLLLKKGARGKEYLLSRENPDLSPIIKGEIDKGSHLQVDYLSPIDFSAFFEAVASSSSIVSLGLSAEGCREIKKTGLDFFQSLAEALQRNFQRWVTLSQEDLEGAAKNLRLLVLDLRNCEVTLQEVRPFFICIELEELWLPACVLGQRAEQKHSLLHLLVQESPMNNKLAKSLIAQGIALSSRDHKERTPLELARELGLMPGAREMANFLEQAAKKKLVTIAFGKKDWEKYCGKVGKEPPLPRRILEVLESPCPIWPYSYSAKKHQVTADTHLLTLIPEKIDGKPLTLDYLQQLVQNAKRGGNRIDYRRYDVQGALGATPSGASYWVLLTKNPLPGSASMLLYEQLQELNKVTAIALQAEGLGPYQAPKMLELATSAIMEYVRSGARPYSTFPGLGNYQLTYCESQARMPAPVLGFGNTGVDLLLDRGQFYEPIGLGGVRRCVSS